MATLRRLPLMQTLANGMCPRFNDREACSLELRRSTATCRSGRVRRKERKSAYAVFGVVWQRTIEKLTSHLPSPPSLFPSSLSSSSSSKLHQPQLDCKQVTLLCGLVWLLCGCTLPWLRIPLCGSWLTLSVLSTTSHTRARARARTHTHTHHPSPNLSSAMPRSSLAKASQPGMWAK